MISITIKQKYKNLAGRVGQFWVDLEGVVGHFILNCQQW